MLHNEQYVLGDLQELNILFNESGKLKLIDFDWAGWYEKDTDASSIGDDRFACYPLSMSSDIRWPQGAGSLELIVPQHDIEMLDKFCPNINLIPAHGSHLFNILLYNTLHDRFM
jgi:serine/threonine protein kinase